MMCFSLGGIAYGMVEIMFRGYTHWTMILTGGIVMVLINLINQTENVNIFIKCLLGATVITSLEFCVGMTVNNLLGWGIWDYADKPFNIYGQVCPQFCLAWFALCFPAFSLSSFIGKRLSLR